MKTLAPLALALLACLSATACDPGEIELSPTDEALSGPISAMATPTGLPCENVGELAACPDGSNAMCDYMGASDGYEYGPCLTDEELVCIPGDTRMTGVPTEDDPCSVIYWHCESHGGVPEWVEETCYTPLVLQFDAGPIEMIAAESTPMSTFDINMSEGSCVTTDWPSAATPWLVADLDRSGTIDGGHELFGSGTRLASGARASDGFAALTELDGNRDGVVDGEDPRFAELMLWRDFDADRRSTFAELEPLASAGIERLSVDYRIERECDERGNCGVQRASFSFGGEVGQIVDLYLACQ